VEVVSGADLSTVMVGPTAAGQFTIPTQAGQTYVIQRTAQPLNGVTYAQMSGSSATSYKALSSVSIGLPGNPAPPIVAGPAGPSSNVVGADAGAGGANVSWKSPSDPGSGSVTAYAVYAYSYTGPAVMEETTNPTMLVTGMAQNQYYTFTVTAWNGVGWGSWSNWSNWTWVT
jgi:hypothetical protein